MKTPLDKITKKINIEDYSLKDLAEYFEKFDNYECIIKTETKLIKFKIHKETFPHLIGMQYLAKSKKYKGKLGLETIKNNNITFNQIKNTLKYNKNYNYIINNIKLRLEYLPMFFNSLNSNYHLRKINKNNIFRKTLLKGNYLLFRPIKNKNNTIFPMLSLKLIKQNFYIIETFIVEEDMSLIGTLKEEKILNIELTPPQIIQIT